MKRYIASFLIVAILAFFVPTEKAYAGAPTDFISCYELNETSGTRADTNTTNANDLTDNNTVLYGTGKQGSAADFELSTSESLEDATTSGLPTGNGARTITAWVNFESLPPNDTGMYIVDYGGEVANQEFNLAIVNLSNVKYFWMDRYNAATISTTYSFSTATWYFFALTYDGTNLKWYVNNTLHDTKSVGATLSTANDDFNIGRKGVSTQNLAFMDGLVDIVEIYDRVLTADEMTALYNSGSGVACAGRATASAPSLPRAVINSKVQIGGKTQL